MTTNHTDALDAAAIALYRRAVAIAGQVDELKAAARQLVLDAAERHPEPAVAAPPPPARAVAVVRGGARNSTRRASSKLGAVDRVLSAVPVGVTTADVLDRERANDELRAAARFGSWQP